MNPLMRYNNRLVPFDHRDLTPELMEKIERSLSAYEFRVLTTTTILSPVSKIVEMISILQKMMNIGVITDAINTPQTHTTVPDTSGTVLNAIFDNPVTNFGSQPIIVEENSPYSPIPGGLDITQFINVAGGNNNENNGI